MIFRLDPVKIGQLKNILTKSSYLNTSEERRNFLSICGLENYCSSLKLELPQDKFIINLLAQLSNVNITVNKLDKPGLIIFLEYICQLESSFDRQEYNFIQDIITSWDTKGFINNLMDKERNNILLQSSPVTLVKPMKIERGFILEYNLEKAVSTFRKKVGYQGVSFFSVGGDRQILSEYIIKRLKLEFRQKTKHQNRQIEIRLSRKDITKSVDIEQRILEKYKFNCILDLFDEDYSEDTLLIIWNYDIPTKILKPLALEFCNNLSKSLSPLLKMKNHCFPIVWANINKSPLPEFNKIYSPKEFELSELIPWMQRRLTDKQLDQKQIEYYLNRLKDQEGNLIRTYQEINLIISELQNFSRLYE